MTQAPMLPLRAADLNSLTSVGILAAWMLCPDDATRRERIALRYSAQDFLARMNQLPADKPLSLTPAALTEVVARALEAANRGEIEAWQREREETGLLAGGVVWDALRGKPVGAASKKMDGIARAGRPASASSRFDNKRKIFKPVVALWAAYVETFDPGDPGLFPCRPEHIMQFLAVSEGLRRAAEQTVPSRRGGPILPPGVSVRLPYEVTTELPELSPVLVPRVVH